MKYCGGQGKDRAMLAVEVTYGYLKPISFPPFSRGGFGVRNNAYFRFAAVDGCSLLRLEPPAAEAQQAGARKYALDFLLQQGVADSAAHLSDELQPVGVVLQSVGENADNKRTRRQVQNTAVMLNAVQGAGFVGQRQALRQVEGDFVANLLALKNV